MGIASDECKDSKKEEVLVVNFGPRPHRLRLLRATKKGCRRDLGRKNNEEGLKKGHAKQKISCTIN